MNSNEVFDAWNHEKKAIHNDGVSRTYYVNEREIWFVKMGKNIGFEENGKEEFARPVLVIKKVGNMFFTVALTTKGKSNNRFYYQLTGAKFIGEHTRNTDNSYAILSQARSLDKKRFLEKIGHMIPEEFVAIKQKLTETIL